MTAGASPLAGVYRNLTRDNSDPFPFFKQLLDRTSTITTGNLDDPFPLVDPRIAVSSGCAGARTPDHLDVFWVGPDGAIATQWWDGAPGANWGDHRPFAITPPDAAEPGSAVAVVTRTANHLDVFWVGPDGAIATQWWDGAPGANWGDHQPFAITRPDAAEPGSAVAAVARTPNHLDVFWVGPDGAIATQWWDGAPGANWGDHQPFAITPPGAAQAGSRLAAVARMPNHLDVFWVGPDGAVATQWWDGAPGANWGDHRPFPITPPGAAQVGSAVAAVARTPNHLDVFWVGPDGAIATQWWDGAPGANWGDHQPFAITPPGAAQAGSRLAAVARMPNHLDVFWVGPDGAVATQWWDGAPGQPGRPPALRDHAARRRPSRLPSCRRGADAQSPRRLLGGSRRGGRNPVADGAPGANWGDHQPFAITPPGAAQAAPGDLKTSPSSAVARTPNHLDVFWVGPDGAVATQWWDGAPGANWGRPPALRDHAARRRSGRFCRSYRGPGARPPRRLLGGPGRGGRNPVVGRRARRQLGRPPALRDHAARRRPSRLPSCRGGTDAQSPRRLLGGPRRGDRNSVVGRRARRQLGRPPALRDHAARRRPSRLPSCRGGTDAQSPRRLLGGPRRGDRN